MSNTVKTYTATNDEAKIILTKAAIAHVERYIARQEAGKHLRISVKTAGCNGLQYVYDIVAEPKADDYAFPHEHFTVYVAEKSMPFIKGSTFDYVETGMQRGWQVSNPQEKGACGCGESFTV